MSLRNQLLNISDEKGENLTHHMVKQPFSVSVRQDPQAAPFVLRMQL